MAREFAHHLIERDAAGADRQHRLGAGLSHDRAGAGLLAAKAGLIHLTQVLAMELARYGILVNAIAPGYVETDFNRDFLRSEAGQKARRRASRCGGSARPDDLDGAMLLLASPARAYITGAVIAVDGGHGVAAI